MDWLRWHHGTVGDPKWRVISRICSVTHVTPVTVVVTIWATMLESASQNTDNRGVLSGWEAEEIAALLDLDIGQVESVYQAMQGRLLNGNVLISWEKRNPKREREDNSAERVKRHREAKKEAQRQVTEGNATKRLDKIREDKKEERELLALLEAVFRELWSDYPAPTGRKEAERHFKATVKSAGNVQEIRQALENYKKHLAVNHWKQPQSGKTWFNNWPDWVNYKESKPELGKMPAIPKAVC